MKTRSMIFFTLCFTLLFMFSSQIKTNAEAGDVYEVGTSNLNMRSAPSYEAPVVGQLQPGEQVPVFQEIHGWAQTYYAGETVWIASHYLVRSDAKISSENGSQSASTVQMTASGVHLRAGPGLDYSIIGATASGDQFQLLDISGEWIKIALSNGSGWVSSQFTNHSNTATEPTTNKRTTSNGSLAGRTIVLDPGHGGKDPGSIGFDDTYEKDVINPTTDKIAHHLQNAGANVILTRSQDAFVSLEDRIRISNVNQPDAFISIHFNAFPLPMVRGISTYYYSGGKSKGLARSLQSSLNQVNNAFDRGIRQGDYKVLRENNSLAVLVELGFITNPAELQTVQTNTFQQEAAQAVTNGFIHYFSN